MSEKITELQLLALRKMVKTGEKILSYVRGGQRINSIVANFRVDHQTVLSLNESGLIRPENEIGKYRWYEITIKGRSAVSEKQPGVTANV